jgi:membrane-associated phospholipid phosphatase
MRNSIFLEAADILSMSTCAIYFIPLTTYIITHNLRYLWVTLGLGLTTILSESLKPLFLGISPRPHGAFNCNALCNDGPQGGRSGMPSSHSATVAFFATFYILETQSITIRLALLIYIIAVMASRYIKNCHTIPQIIGGALLGTCLSLQMRAILS